MFENSRKNKYARYIKPNGAANRNEHWRPDPRCEWTPGSKKGGVSLVSTVWRTHWWWPRGDWLLFGDVDANMAKSKNNCGHVVSSWRSSNNDNDGANTSATMTTSLIAVWSDDDGGNNNYKPHPNESRHKQQQNLATMTVIATDREAAAISCATTDKTRLCFENKNLNVKKQLRQRRIWRMTTTTAVMLFHDRGRRQMLSSRFEVWLSWNACPCSMCLLSVSVPDSNGAVDKFGFISMPAWLL